MRKAWLSKPFQRPRWTAVAKRRVEDGAPRGIRQADAPSGRAQPDGAGPAPAPRVPPGEAVSGAPQRGRHLTGVLADEPTPITKRFDALALPDDSSVVRQHGSTRPGNGCPGLVGAIGHEGAMKGAR